MGRKRNSRGRPVHGILLLDKPAGLTSNQVLQQVKGLYQARKAGHTGSLDRPATGLLPLCFGEATKFSSFLLEADKTYHVVCQLGAETTTGDGDGEITAQFPLPACNTARLETVLARFKGEIEQVPPMYSALKQNGQRLYKLAYEGREVERQPRLVRVHELRLNGYTAETIELTVRCSKGTYIRTLAQDIGRQLGCGAHVKSLRRTAVGPFTDGNMTDLTTLRELAADGLAAVDSLLAPIDTVLAHIPSVNLVDTVSYYLCQGQPVMVPHAPSTGILRIYSENSRFLGIGEVLADGRVAPKRLVNLQAQP